MQLIRASENYKVKLSDFEGPLDLLLHLIRESKLDIKTIRLAEVTAQYMGFLKELDKLDLDLASEFIEVGAVLLEIKSRNILPHEVEEEDPEEIEQRLKAQLEEYKLLKDAGERLRPLENVNRFYKEPAVMKPSYHYTLENLGMDDLVKAFQKILFRTEQKAAPIEFKQIKLDRFTVADKIRDIRTRVDGGSAVKFFDLFEADFTRSEIINTFLALLELLKHQEIRATQQDLFSDIIIEKGEGHGTAPETSEFENPVVAEN